MDLQSRKIEFVQEFLAIQSEEVVARLEKLLQKERAAYLAEAPEPMTV